MTANTNLYALTIGDWSCDGHSLYRQYAVQTNETLENLREAYFKSCQQSRIKFHNGKEGDIDGANYVVVCTECDDDGLSKEAEERFKAFGINLEDEKYQRCMWYGSHRFEDIENFAYLLMDFIKQSLPTMEYEFIDMSTSKLEKLPSLNGFWQKSFNLGFGYGLNNVFCDESDDYHGDREDEEGEDE
jgi:hypothetical protein